MDKLALQNEIIRLIKSRFVERAKDPKYWTWDDEEKKWFFNSSFISIEVEKLYRAFHHVPEGEFLAVLNSMLRVGLLYNENDGVKGPRDVFYFHAFNQEVAVPPSLDPNGPSQEAQS